MSRILGRAVKARIGYQDDAATLSDGPWTNFCFYEITPPADPDFVDDPIICPTNDNERDMVAPLRALPGGTLRIVAPLDLAMLGHWLKFAHTTLASSGSSPDYAHAAESSVSTLNYATIQVQYSSGVTVQYKMCALNSYTINYGKAPDYGRIEMSWEVSDWTNGTDWLAGTVASALTEQRLLRTIGKVSWGGTTIGDALEASLTFSNGLERYNTMNGDEFPTEMDTGLTSVTGTMRLRFKDSTFAALSKANTAAALILDMSLPSAPTSRRLRFTLAAARLRFDGRPLTGPGAIDETFSFRGEQGTSTPALQVSLLNAIAGASYA